MKSLNKRTIIGIIFALLILVIGIIMTTLNFETENSQFLITLGIAVTVGIIVVYFKRINSKTPDEREIKIAYKAISYSWSFTYLIVAIMILIDQLKIYSFTVQQVLAITFFSMAFIQFGYKFYLDKNGVV